MHRSHQGGARSIDLSRGLLIFGVISLLLAACSGDLIEPGPELSELTELSLTGQVFTVDGTIPASLVVSVSSEAGTTEVDIARDGRFAATLEVTGDSVQYLIMGSGWTSLYHPTLIEREVSSSEDLTVILIPRRWTIEGGTYQGNTINISLDAAFRPPCSDFQDVNCDGFYPRVWVEGLKLWRLASLPVPIAFAHSRSTDPITAQDSVEYWSIVEKMHADFGAELFRPALYEDLRFSDDLAIGGILVWVDSSLDGFGAWANWWWNASGEMVSGKIRLASSSRFNSIPLVTHELMHMLGFKHSCSWVSVMGGYGCSSFEGLSASDVAFAQLAFAVNERQREVGARYGLLEALQGERVITLQAQPFIAPDLERLKGLRMDGVWEAEGT